MQKYVIAVVSAAILLAAAAAPALAAFDTYLYRTPACTLPATACAVQSFMASHTPGPGFGAAASTAARS